MEKREKEEFCIECGDYRPYVVKTSNEELTIRGITFSYREQSAYCTDCGEEIYVPEINDANAQARDDSYRKAARIITVSEIKEILEKYNVGAGPLAILLGFGEITIDRYLHGQLPSRDNSKTLLDLRASHTIMSDYLEKGKDLITQVAYRKCREAIDKLNNLNGNNKIEIVARYILYKTSDITPLALQKLLYYSQAFFHALFHNDLFLDDCQAWAYGPVYSDVYYRYREYGYNPIDMPIDNLNSDFCDLSSIEKELIDSVICVFGKYSGMVLSQITHCERPWTEARGDLQPDDRSVTVISRSSINEYFDNVVSDLGINNSCEIHKYCYRMLSHLTSE